MVSTEERGNSLSAGGSPSHMTSCTRLFIEQWEATLFSRGETTARLWGGGKRTGGIAVWVGLRYTLVEREPSSLCNTVGWELIVVLIFCVR